MEPIDYLKVAIIAFVGVWVINKALDKTGLSKYRA